MYAYQLRAKLNAGLSLTTNEQGEDIQWIGSRQEFEVAERLEDAYEEWGDLDAEQNYERAITKVIKK